MTTDAYFPEEGDIIWTVFDPVLGREQAGRRPAVVVSPAHFYQISRMLIVCPVTTKVRPFPSSIILQGTEPIEGEVLVAHVRSLDMLIRPFNYAGASLSNWQLNELRGKLAGLLGIE